ncbi:MAG: MFS transporter [Sphingomonas sp. SCN 67-18]|uniref:MFS transporter n=1 Tax=uncultured Sphingomonas sp. TaxID=158754 RepID=UPI0008683C6F|nr:MFS transporter [Sphingomonas sp. SCN 67-18]ODU21295.1 MAG: MFS transporter [Sphingomonas sp. SCN 67-18]
MKRPWTVILCGAAVVTLAMGVRQAFGLFLPQMSAALDISRGSFGLALALQNLLFGLAQPVVGAIADKHGAGRVIFFGALLYIAGLVAAAMATSAIGLHLSFGVAIGMALSATTFVVVLGAVGRVVAPEQRSLSFGIITAGGSLGQFLVVPAGQMLLAELGYRLALIALAGLIALCCALAVGLAGKPVAVAQEQSSQRLSDALGEASRHSGYLLLNAGFFVCGFHVAFIATHFPAYLNDRGLGLQIGASALALIGLFNIFGSYVFGMAGDRFRMKWLLSAIYGLRAVIIALFLLLPLTSTSALVFAAAMGFLWLGTVPLTSGLVGRIFGMRYLSTLYGVVFLSHQIGSFFGAWAAGQVYDMFGSYDIAWTASIILGVVAMLLHLPIRDTPVARLQPA